MKRRVRFGFLLLAAFAAVTASAETIAVTGTGRTIRLDPSDTGNAIVEFREAPLFAHGVSAQSTATALEARQRQFERDLENIDRDVRIVRRFSRVFAGVTVSASRESIARIAALDYVAAVHRDRIFHMSAEPGPNVVQVRANEVWTQFGTRGRGIRVAVLDTGIDYTHAALGGGFGDGKKVAGGYDFVNDDTDPRDDNGHGTHVAGIVAGDGTNFTGVAPEATLFAYKVLGASGSGSLDNILAAIERVADPNLDGDPSDHFDIANLSLGGPPAQDDPLVNAVERATELGVTFCIAAGNIGAFSSVRSPATAPSAIAVGAVDASDNLAAFSSRGPLLKDDGYAIKPEIVAPGVEIVSAQRGGGTLPMSGTSMATPHVAGVCALLRAVHPNWSPRDLKSAVVNTSKTLDFGVMSVGGGRLDALAAAQAMTLVSPSTIAFGLADNNAETWTSTRTVRVRNDSALDETYTLTARSLPEGATMTATPSSFTLAAGASRDVSVAIRVAKTVPPPSDDSLSYGGSVNITGTRSAVHVPWAFVKGAVLIVNTPAQQAMSVLVAGNHTFRFVELHADAPRAELLMPAGTYEITGYADDRLYVFEQRKLEAETEIRFDPSLATVGMTLDPRNERGEPLLERPLAYCKPTLVIEYPQAGSVIVGGPTPDIRYIAMDLPTSAPIRMTPISARYRIVAGQACHDLQASSLYLAQFAPQRGITSNVTLRNDPSQFVAQDVRSVHRPRGNDPRVYEIFTLSSLRLDIETEEGLATASLNLHFEGAFLPQAREPIHLFMTPEPVPFAHLDATVFAFVSAYPWPVPTDYPNPLGAVFRNVGGRILPINTIGEQRITHYVPPAGTPIVIGDGPVHPTGGMFFLQDNLDFERGLFAGPVNEDRMNNERYNPTRFALFDSLERELAPVVPGIYRRPDPGRYRLDAMTQGYNVAGLPSAGTQQRWFEIGGEDYQAPVLTSFRILDAIGVASSTLVTNAHASLLFSAADYKGEMFMPLAYERVRSESTRAWWRPHGTTEWRALGVVEAGEDLNDRGAPPQGVLYRASLDDITRSAGAIDLRVRIEDQAGNAMEWTVEPGLYVTSKRRSSRPSS